MDEQLSSRVDACVAHIRGAQPALEPRVGLILGSGLGSFADGIEQPTVLPYASLPGFATASVVGHAGRLVLGTVAGVPVVTMQGRVHAYEGYSPEEVTFPARVLCRMGIRVLIVTNAAGGIASELRVGDLMAIRDHLNLSGRNPLVGHNDARLGPRFPDMSNAYDATLRERLRTFAQREGLVLHEGVYAYLLGPSYETPAEIRMLRTLGAHAVGMSTVPEVIVAAHMGVKTLGISCITNMAAGLSPHALSHDDVGRAAKAAEARFSRLVSGFIAELAPTLGT